MQGELGPGSKGDRNSFEELKKKERELKSM